MIPVKQRIRDEVHPKSTVKFIKLHQNILYQKTPKKHEYIHGKQLTD